MLLVILLSMVVGGLCTIIFQIIIFYSYVRNQPFVGHVRKPLTLHEKAKIPKDLGKYQDIVAKKESLNCLNFVFAFLFSELRDTDRLRRWVIKKMNVEFDELLQSKTLGRVIEALTVRDYSLGPHLPTFKNATLLKAKPSDMELAPEELDIGLEVEYNGGFRLAVDADLVFGKAVYVCITLKYLKGHGRLQFTRHPYTHWSFAFFTEPEMEFEIESQFEGRVVTQLGSLIVNQIRRSVRKKHTLPNYKIRYKPFFIKSDPPHLMDDVVINDSKITIGKLDVTVVECSRLPPMPMEAEVFCTLVVESTPYKDKNSGHKSGQGKMPYDTVEVEIQRGNKSLPIGTLFKQEVSAGEDVEELVVLETITPSSPASSTELKKGDVLVAIDGGKVTSVKTAAKLIKQAGEKVLMKVRRPVINVPDDVNMPETLYAEESVTIKPDEDVAKKQDSKDDDDFVNITIKKVDTTALDGQTCVAASSSALEVEESLAATIKQKVTSSPMMIRRKLQSSYGVGVRVLSGKGDEEKDDKTLTDTNKGSKSNDGNKHSVTDERAKLNATGVKDSSKDGTGKNGDIRQESSLQVKDSSGIPSRRGSSTSMKDVQIDGEFGEGGRDVTDGASVNALFTKLEDIGNSDVKKTSEVPAMLDPSWDETFQFDVYDCDQYLNVCVWGKGVITGKPDKETLISYTSVPLMNTALHCLATSSGEYMQTYHLQPPERRAGSSRRGLHPELAAHRGFEESLCYGDVMLLFHHVPDPSIKQQTREEVEGKKKVETLTETESKPKKSASVVAENKNHEEPRFTKKIPIVKDKEKEKEQVVNSTQQPTEARRACWHDWLPTQFFSPTRCDLCTKKVWTKNAFQCRVCAMICHRKCVDKAQTQTYCTKEGARRSSTNLLLAHANKTTKDGESATKDIASSVQANKSPRSSPKLLPRGLQRPKYLRKTGTDVSSDNEGSDSDSMAGSARTLKTQLLQTYGPHSKPGDADALVVAAAKEMGKELFSNLPYEERKEKLNAMISKLQHEIDQESESRTDLFKEEKQCTDPKEKAKLNAYINKSDERLQALALLMLHYCAGLNDCTEQMERDKLKSDEREAEAAAQAVAQDAAQTAAQDVVQDAAQAAMQDVAQDAAQDAVQDAAQDVAQDAAQDVVQDAAKAAAQDVAQDAAKAPMQNVAQAVTPTEDDLQTDEADHPVQELATSQIEEVQAILNNSQDEMPDAEQQPGLKQEPETKPEQEPQPEQPPDTELAPELVPEPTDEEMVREKQDLVEDYLLDENDDDIDEKKSVDIEEDGNVEEEDEEVFKSIEGGFEETIPGIKITAEDEGEVQEDGDFVDQEEDVEETTDKEEIFKDVVDIDVEMMDEPQEEKGP
ncbi:PDZ domain-containing protein 8-like [Glandiceps talaboti]